MTRRGRRDAGESMNMKSSVDRMSMAAIPIASLVLATCGAAVDGVLAVVLLTAAAIPLLGWAVLVDVTRERRTISESATAAPSIETRAPQVVRLVRATPMPATIVAPAHLPESRAPMRLVYPALPH